MENKNTLPESGFIRVKALQSILGMSRPTIWRKARAGTFPKPVKLSDNITAWRVEDVRAWMENLKEAC